VEIAACIAWQNVEGDAARVCPTPGNETSYRFGTTPNNKAKCNCDPMVLPIDIAASLDIEKQSIGGTGEFDFTVVSTRQSEQQGNTSIVRQRCMCFREISARELCLSPAEVVLAEKEVQRSVLCRDLGGGLKLRNALRDLLIFDQHETFVDQIFESLFIVNLCARENTQTESIAVHVLFLFECVALAALAPHSLESLIVNNSILSQ
jgi:hypothetical protein